MKGLTYRNYKHRVELLREAIQRFRSKEDWEGALAGYAEAIGNVYREFEPDQAPRWYKQSLEWLRARFQEPSMRAAFLYWKLGDTDDLGAELETVLRLCKRQTDTQARPIVENDTKRINREQELLAALFVKGDYQVAVKEAQSLLRRNEESPPYVKQAIRLMSAGILTRDPTVFDEGMAILKSHIEEWPTSGSSIHTDLYRFGLQLRERAFRS